ISFLADGSLIIAVTGLINFFLGSYLVREGRRHYSLTLIADGKHLKTDAYSSAALVAGLLLIYFTGIYYLDSLLSIALGLYIVTAGYKLTRKSVGGLMDESDFGRIEEIIRIIDDNRRDAWIDIHNFRTQRYCSEFHIDCHVTLPYYYDLNHVHEEISKIDTLVNQKEEVKTEFFIHADPCLPQCCHYCRMKNCPVRTDEKTTDITWTLENVTRNQKHFDRF